MELIEPIHLI
jgi:hypothetical protein